MMARRGTSVPALCAQLLLFIALCSATGNNKPGENKTIPQQTFCGQPLCACAAGFPGFPGIPGPAGPAGAAGSPGNRGPEGPMGPRGSKGDEGPRGRRGVPGSKGATGLSGPTGARGRRGEKGAPGSRGAPGRKGADGFLVKNWKQCVFPKLSDGRDTGLVKIAKISMTSPVVINVPTRALLAGETKGSFAQWLANLNIKRNLTSTFANKYLPLS